MVWKLEFAVVDAEGSIEMISDATHKAALSSGPPPGTRPAIDAAIPVRPAKKLCRLNCRGVAGRAAELQVGADRRQLGALGLEQALAHRLEIAEEADHLLGDVGLARASR